MNRARRKKERQAGYWIGWAVCRAIRDQCPADRRLAKFLIGMADAIRPLETEKPIALIASVDTTESEIA